MTIKQNIKVALNKKGASLIELILVVGAISLITVYGMQMYKHQANKTGLNFQTNVDDSLTTITE